MREAAKKLLFAVSALFSLPFVIVYVVGALIAGRERSFQALSQTISLIPGVIGQMIRKGFYWCTIHGCSPNSTIGFGTFLATKNVSIGRYVYIGARCIIADSIIEDDVMIGSNVNVLSGKGTHSFDDLETPIRLQGGEKQPVRIGEDSWIGNCAIIMADIGKKCIVGAGSVVTKPVEDYSIVAGNPARLIRKRL